jgi:hemerythrin-like domain-containing protein
MLHEHERGRALLRGVLFPIAEQILAEEEQRVIVQAFDAIEQAVVGPGIHERLLAKLAELEGR